MYAAREMTVDDVPQEWYKCTIGVSVVTNVMQIDWMGGLQNTSDKQLSVDAICSYIWIWLSDSNGNIILNTRCEYSKFSLV